MSSILNTDKVKINGEFLTDLPDDLYIPPDALRVFLETFEGPLDLLLYLIRKQNIDILNIPIAKITQQYIVYIQMMRQIQLDLAGEYLLMAATLAEIKSRFLLPQEVSDDEQASGDPRAELMRRLQIYEQFKKAAHALDKLPRIERDFFSVNVFCPNFRQLAPPHVSLDALVKAALLTLKREKLFSKHQVSHDILPLRERMTVVIDRLSSGEPASLQSLLDLAEGRMGLVVTLMAILELMRQSVISLEQLEPYAPITLKIKVSL